MSAARRGYGGARARVPPRRDAETVAERAAVRAAAIRVVAPLAEELAGRGLPRDTAARALAVALAAAEESVIGAGVRAGGARTPWDDMERVTLEDDDDGDSGSAASDPRLPRFPAPPRAAALLRAASDASLAGGALRRGAVDAAHRDAFAAAAAYECRAWMTALCGVAARRGLAWPHGDVVRVDVRPPLPGLPDVQLEPRSGAVAYTPAVTGRYPRPAATFEAVVRARAEDYAVAWRLSGQRGGRGVRPVDPISGAILGKYGGRFEAPVQLAGSLGRGDAGSATIPRTLGAAALAALPTDILRALWDDGSGELAYVDDAAAAAAGDLLALGDDGEEDTRAFLDGMLAAHEPVEVDASAAAAAAASPAPDALGMPPLSFPRLPPRVLVPSPGLRYGAHVPASIRSTPPRAPPPGAVRGSRDWLFVAPLAVRPDDVAEDDDGDAGPPGPAFASQGPPRARRVSVGREVAGLYAPGIGVWGPPTLAPSHAPGGRKRTRSDADAPPPPPPPPVPSAPRAPLAPWEAAAASLVERARTHQVPPTRGRLVRASEGGTVTWALVNAVIPTAHALALLPSPAAACEVLGRLPERPSRAQAALAVEAFFIAWRVVAALTILSTRAVQLGLDGKPTATVRGAWLVVGRDPKTVGWGRRVEGNDVVWEARPAIADAVAAGDVVAWCVPPAPADPFLLRDTRSKWFEIAKLRWNKNPHAW